MNECDRLLKSINDTLERIGFDGNNLYVQSKIALEMQCDNLWTTMNALKVEPAWKKYPAATGFFWLYRKYYR